MKRFSLRLPDGLHDRLAAQARANRRSLNDEILYLVEKGLKPMSRTYRIATQANVDFVTRVEYLDYSADVDASTETELVGEFLIADEDTARFERELDASPAVVRWEEVPTGQRWRGRIR